MVDGVRTDGEVDATEDKVDDEGMGGEKTSMLRLERGVGGETSTMAALLILFSHRFLVRSTDCVPRLCTDAPIVDGRDDIRSSG